MESPDGPPVVNFTKSEGLGKKNQGLSEIFSAIDSLKKQVFSHRRSYIQRRVEENCVKMKEITKNFHKSSDRPSDEISRRNSTDSEPSVDLLSHKMEDATINGRVIDTLGYAPIISSPFEPVKLAHVKRLPDYTTWTFLDKNQRMKEDQSVVGQKIIYYQQRGGEALVSCVSDDDDEEAIVEVEEKKGEFAESEDYILRMTIKEVGLCEAVLDALAQCLSRKPCEVKARFEVLNERESAMGGSSHNTEAAPTSSCLIVDEEDLNATLDSFDNLFCRRCLVFDCKLHGCSQDLIFPAEKQLPWSPDEEETLPPCAFQCYRQVLKSDGIHKGNNTNGVAEPVAVTLQKRKKNNFLSDSHNEIEWKVIEKDLFEKGVEIFGRNSCLIARNLMNGTKTCSEVFQFMNRPENNGLDLLTEGCSNDDGKENVDTQLRRRSRFFRRRGRKVRRLKNTWNSTYCSFRRRNSEKKERQYNPCGCQSATCGKGCICLSNKTCCEKYCGCPKSCENRFRGCYCVKSQCRGPQCPCFVANRGCDPDVCRNCWISCGDGSLGVPGERGDSYECMNMKLLLKQHQKLLLGRSDVSGWGAFLKNSVSENEYIGEYTGEVISQHEAEKREKIYENVINSSYLFDLNDQCVLDAYRKGNKLKFANHSFDPNCYARIEMVAGDHRVGIFAKRQISAGEELLYDYGSGYIADWMKKLRLDKEASGSKKANRTPNNRRAKKTPQPSLVQQS